MKRAALLLFLAAQASALTPDPVQVAQTYGENLLRTYAAQGSKLAPGRAATLSCDKVLAPVPAAVKQCRLHLWGAQAVAELLYVQGNKMTGMRQLWVGQMSGLPSDKQLGRLGRALARDYNRWKKSPAAEQWYKQAAATQGHPGYGYVVPCAVFSKQRLPAGVLSCVQGPGPADGPTLMLGLAGGRTFTVSVP